MIYLTDEQLLAITRPLYSSDVAANMAAAADIKVSRAILAAAGAPSEEVPAPVAEIHPPGYNPWLAAGEKP